MMVGTRHKMEVCLPFVIGLCFITMCGCAEFTYYYNIYEEVPPAHSTFIGNIPNDTNLKSMVSEADFSNLQYSFLTEGDYETTKYFSLDENTGNLRTSSDDVLDRETLCPFASTCVLSLEIAIKSKLTQFFRTVALEISIADVNDNAPKFPTNKKTLNISEEVVTGASFALDGAVDRDTGANNSLQTYTIQPEDGPFELQFSKNIDGTSYLNLVVREKLNHEERNLYNVQVIAVDGGVPPNQGVLSVEINVIDMNDNRPRFTQDSYSVVVEENVAQNFVILVVNATDADSGANGEVRYSLSSHQAVKNQKLFAINPQTGELSVTGELQSEPEEKYDIIVEASDMGVQPFTTQTVVTVEVLDTINNPPRIRVNLLTSQVLNFSLISEYANLGVVVAHIRVYESDRGRNGIVKCELIQHNYFELQGFDVNEYKVIVAKPLDRESKAEHTLTVQCEDAGTPPLSVNASFIVKVTDENDNAPQFSRAVYSATIRENNKIGDSVLTVVAQDVDEGINSDIRYSLSPMYNREEFIISPESGLILANTRFDYETKSVMNFSVIAVDSGNPPKTSTAKVTVRVIDVNDQKPTFSHSVFHFNVSESAKLGQNVGQIIAFDFETGGNGEVYISLSPEIDNISPFALFQNGTIILNGSIDHEARNQYEFRVSAIDRGTPPLNATTYVRISILDENDNMPVITYPNITHHSTQISTDYQIDSIITSVQAKDADFGVNAQLKYVITSRNDSGRFEIDAKTGEISVTKHLSKNDINMYKFMIMVQDGGVPPHASHTILFVNIVAGNGSAMLGTHGHNDQNVLITVTIICVTAIVSAIIVLVIIVMKRKDKQRTKTPEGSMYLQPPSSLTQYVDKVKVDNVRTSKGVENHTDEEFGFSGRKEKDAENMKNDSNSQYSLSKETRDESDGRLDQLAVLQLHQALLQTYQGHQLSNTQKIAAWQRGQDDVHSDASGETTTSDSGRGGSEEDICSHSGASASQIEDLHEMSRDTLLNNTSFQSSQTIPSSLKSGLKDNVRASVRKHVTFRDLSDKGHHDIYPEPSQHHQVPPSKHHPVRNMDKTYPQNPPLKPPSRGPQNCGFTVRNPTFTSDNFYHGGCKKSVGDFHLPVQDHISHVRDWRNDSIATTDDGDDRSTTTSGSYTIDNDESCVNLDFNDFKDVVV
ncbi:protocadherin beta-6-like isoform X2 [Haliotis rufescens]|uniref:protocadherin beta-6-like isoform X2 n=1 Tax=Haliotis rufescens TaxID=6454 RepID=UPI00201F03DE|nr:protocadherin beta-6-like isoform X2 [Haliotis rufescens]